MRAMKKERMRCVRSAIDRAAAENDQLPAGPEIARHIGFRSANASVEHLVALEKKGCVERNAVGRYRSARSKACESAPAASTTC